MSTIPGNPLLRLRALGQSVWLDDLRRAWLYDGTLSRLIDDDGLCGLTSNPAIFKKSIVEHHDYDAAIASLARQNADAKQIYETLIVEDVQGAADLLKRVYETSDRRDGYVSLEVSPHLAYDAEGTLDEAKRLWSRVNRPNLMIKVPGTRAGLPAIRRLIALGINVNVTLLFSVDRYLEVAAAFMSGLEELTDRNPVSRVASVASFFLSRIDVLIDKRLDASGSAKARLLRGKAAVASARLAYRAYKQLLSSPRWQALTQRGARSQRLLWASTGTKDPTYSDVKYVEAVIGPETVDTMPLETLIAYRDHGAPAARLEEDLEDAAGTATQLAALDLDLLNSAQQLEDEGVRKFVEPFDQLLATLQQRIDALRPPP